MATRTPSFIISMALVFARRATPVLVLAYAAWRLLQIPGEASAGRGKRGHSTASDASLVLEPKLDLSPFSVLVTGLPRDLVKHATAAQLAESFSSFGLVVHVAIGVTEMGALGKAHKYD